LITTAFEDFFSVVGKKFFCFLCPMLEPWFPNSQLSLVKFVRRLEYLSSGYIFTLWNLVEAFAITVI
jgi:hypothetical protein